MELAVLALHGIFDLKTRAWMGVPRLRSIFPFVVCQRPLTGAVRVHHKKLSLGLRNVVVERSLFFQSKTSAAEANMLSIWRPYLMCVISRGGGQSPQTGPVRPDRVNVKVAFTKARQSDEIALWRPCKEIVKSGSQLCCGPIVQTDDPKTAFRFALEAIHDPLTIRRPARKRAVSLSLGELMEFRAILAHQPDAGWSAGRGKIQSSPKSNPVVPRWPSWGKRDNALLSTKNELSVRPVRIHYRHRRHRHETRAKISLCKPFSGVGIRGKWGRVS